ncbi:hypothetical protein SBBP1_220016 [Burkholderiales bacterium]|nr:hypothetical protein SBBP1_220016 [Burkholderiales bacterium]
MTRRKQRREGKRTREVGVFLVDAPGFIAAPRPAREHCAPDEATAILRFHSRGKGFQHLASPAAAFGPIAPPRRRAWLSAWSDVSAVTASRPGALAGSFAVTVAVRSAGGRSWPHA